MAPRYVLSQEERILLRKKEISEKKQQEVAELQELEDLYEPFKPRVAVLTLTEESILNKKISIPKEPTTPTSVLLLPVGGIPQVYGKDFIVNGTELIWKGLGLDNFLDTSDILIFHY